MNITLLIGNGFDRNLGLDTAYSQFIDFYKTTPGKTENLKKFREDIEKNTELWSDAEIQLGQCTAQFDKGKGYIFAECQEDFCVHLADYLKNQEQRIDYEYHSKSILSSLSALNNISTPFPTQEKEIINNTVNAYKHEDITFNFICFNYTRTLDNCLSYAKKDPNILGKHDSGNSIHKHHLGKICHVHGTVEKDMVFGVHDESQIGKLDIFDCEDGDLYRDLLIKQRANALYLENKDFEAKKILESSQILYIYGMSIGKTDALWWQRICDWLVANPKHHVILQQHDLPVKTVIAMEYQRAERQRKKSISNYSKLESAKKIAIEKQIHVTNHNIFSSLSNIANIKKPIIDIIEEVNGNDAINKAIKFTIENENTIKLVNNNADLIAKAFK